MTGLTGLYCGSKENAVSTAFEAGLHKWSLYLRGRKLCGILCDINFLRRKILMDYKKMYEEWLANPYFDEATKKELESIKDDENEIRERFYTELEFGTAGLRGIIGAGINRMNVYTVRKATQGLANYINKQGQAAKGVAIAFDSRRMSPEFADVAALCLAANGIKAYVFESLRPTPELSYAVRKLSCIAGINITASHNPPEYNGYKVYWEDGAQITPPHDGGIMAEVKAITDFAVCKTMDKKEAQEKGLYEVIGAAIDDAYMEELKKQVIHWDSIKKVGKDIKIVYTPLHGTGNIPARRVLKEIGFENVYVVPQQELPDGEFPTVSYPNPEAKEAFKLALELAKEKDADLVLATDPDADRLGVYVKDTKSGEYICLTGNMSGCLLADYEISQRKAVNGGLPADGALIKTIVTSNMADAIAKYYGVNLIEVLTGFKFIGQQILGFETKGTGTYLFGFEESYGCLIGTHARDKDAIVATMALCEAAAYYKTQGKTLWDAMIDMYERYGYYKDNVVSIEKKGIEGLAEIKRIMDTLRDNMPESFGNYKVVSTRDYQKDVVKDLATGEEKPTGLPKSNVLYFDMTDNVWLCVRPSGTEPKIKLYYGVVGTSLEDAEKKSEELGEVVKDMLNRL
jgi:phosphoglucomutase